jgi:hypothetical protein
MAKRARRTSAEIVEVNEDGSATVESRGKQYHWIIPSDIVLTKITDTNEFDMTVVHTSEHRAMIDIVSVRNDRTYLRQEINPLSHKHVDEWVVDE